MSRAPLFSRRFANWLSGEDLIGFELGAGEALANCVEHGGGPILSAQWRLVGGRLVAEVRDQGRGFDPRERVKPPPQGAPRGYGLFIMHNVVDGVECMDGGTGPRLFKNLPPSIAPSGLIRRAGPCRANGAGRIGGRLQSLRSSASSSIWAFSNWSRRSATGSSSSAFSANASFSAALRSS